MRDNTEPQAQSKVGGKVKVRFKNIARVRLTSKVKVRSSSGSESQSQEEVTHQGQRPRPDVMAAPKDAQFWCPSTCSLSCHAFRPYDRAPVCLHELVLDIMESRSGELCELARAQQHGC